MIMNYLVSIKVFKHMETEGRASNTWPNVRSGCLQWNEKVQTITFSYFIIPVIKKEHISCILLSVLSRSIVELQSALNLEEKGKTEIKKNQTLFSFIKDSSLCLLNPITLTSVKSYISSSELH